MKKKNIIITCTTLVLIILGITISLIVNREEGIEINTSTFPEETVRKIAVDADKNHSGILSEKEAGDIKEISLKKFAPQDVIDIMGDEPLPSYTDEDFVFDFEGIQHFSNTEKLTINLADGEYFNQDSEEEQIYVKTSNLEKIYELKKLKSLTLYEVELQEVDVQKFTFLRKLELCDMYNMEELVFPEHTQLKSVWIAGSHKLMSIDLSNLKNVKNAYIRCNNSVKSIRFGETGSAIEDISMWELPEVKGVDLSSCPNLESLEIRELPLNALDVSNNIKLRQIYLEQLDINVLDLSKNPAVDEISIDNDAVKKIIVGDDNKIARVRWTNSNISEIPLHNLNPKTLVLLDVLGTKIEKLDVSKFTNLETLYYDKNTTTIIGDVNHLGE